MQTYLCFFQRIILLNNRCMQKGVPFKSVTLNMTPALLFLTDTDKIYPKVLKYWDT